MTPKERAENVAATMWANDKASQWIGMTLVSVDEGASVVDLLVAPHHCNGLGICHGAVSFGLADTAFAFACNSRNQATVAQHNTISYLAPARAGDVLRATATEVSTTRRSGIYDVTVCKADGQRIALFRGHSRTVKGQIFEE